MQRHEISKLKILSVSGVLVLSLAQTAIAQSIHRAKVQIEAGPTVHVSKAFANMPHYENLAVGDPEHPGRLMSCSMAFPEEVGQYCYQHCYVSFDSGKTWDATLRATEGWSSADPTSIYGAGDNAYVVSLVQKQIDHPKDPETDTSPTETKMVVFKSTDAGRTWKIASQVRGIDREFITMDRTKGKYAGRLYIFGQTTVRGIAGGTGNYNLQLFRSTDDGNSLSGPVSAEYPEGTLIAGVGTGAVLSDGTLVMFFGLIKKGRKQSLEDDLADPNGELHAIFSKDGGETMTKSAKIADWKLDRPRSEGGMIGQLAVDPGSKPFKDRLYVVYPEILYGRIQIRTSYSADKGKTWSQPLTVNDDRTPEQWGKGPDHILPSIGVNKDGIVLVTWYDRREAKDNLGWKLRAAASLDGGETFSASVPITNAGSAYLPETAWDVGGGVSTDDKASLVHMMVPIQSFFVSGGHTTGLAVDADGTFHPTWIDNRTGVAQLWSASIKVVGAPIKHGAPDFAELDDISKSVTLNMSRARLDRKTGNVTLAVELKNTSADLVKGPVKLRVLSLESDFGVPEVTNSDNGENGTGASWDLSKLLSGGELPSLKASEHKTLTFRLADLRSLPSGKELRNKSRLLNLDIRVYGKLQKAKPSEGKAEAEAGH